MQPSDTVIQCPCYKFEYKTRTASGEQMSPVLEIQIELEMLLFIHVQSLFGVHVLSEIRRLTALFKLQSCAQSRKTTDTRLDNHNVTEQFSIFMTEIKTEISDF